MLHCIFANVKRLIFTYLLLTFFVFAQAQTNIHQRQLTMDDGLLANSVTQIVQDNRGFLWIGTANGLSRYDGVSIENYRLSELDATHGVNALLALNDGDLLIGTRQTVYQFSFDTEEFTALPLEDTLNVSSLATDFDGNLWIATHNQGVVRYNKKEELVQKYHLYEVSDDVDMIYADNDNQIWALSKDGVVPLWRLDKLTDTFSPANLLSASPNSITMLQTSDKRLWLGTWEHGIMLIHDDGSLEPMPIPTGGHCQHIRTLFELSPTQLLLGCDDGLWVFDTQLHTYNLYTPQRFIQAITRDHEGGLWIGTMHNGVTYLSPIAHRFSHSPVGLTAHFCEDRYGNLWVTREHGGLNCYRNHHLVETFNTSRLDGLSIHSLCADGSNLWIGTYSDGVYQFSPTTGRLRHYETTNDEQSLYDPNSCTLLRDRKGRIWVATMQGLCVYNPNTDRFERKAAVASVPIDIDEDSKGRLWISTQGNGIWRYDKNNGSIKHFRRDGRNEATLSDNIVNSTIIDSNGTLWAGTQNGLCHFDEKNDCFRRVKLGVPRQVVSAIIEDQGALWLSGDFGILRYQEGKNLQRFTRQDGLGSEKFQPNSVWKANDGCIYFGNISGFDSFYPYQIKVNQHAPAVFITGLEINNQRVDIGGWHLPIVFEKLKQLDIWYNDRMFSLSFASLSYCSPEKNMYAYKLEGFDKDWNFVGNTQKVTYTNLPAGKYTFLVRGTNNDGIWSENITSLPIEVHPPYWLSTYAKIFYVILFIVLVTGFIRFRLFLTERRHRKEIALLNEAKKEEMRVARIEFFTMIAHEIRTPVSLIIGPLETLKEKLKTYLYNHSVNTEELDFQELKGTLQVIDRNANRLLELINQLLDFRKVEQHRMEMNFSPQNIRQLLQSVADNFSTALKTQGLKFSVSLPDSQFTASVDREAIVKVVTNLLSNAQKYTHSSIELCSKPLPDGKHFSIAVYDDGEGIAKEDQKNIFDPFFQGRNNKPGTGIGLNIVKHVVEQHHGTIDIQSEPGKGTRFTIILPIAQDFNSDSKAVDSPSEKNDVSPAIVEQKKDEKPTMLIVDDNEDMLTFLVTTFMDNFETIAAHDGNEALQILKESLVVKDGQTPTSTVDIIISDWMMPDTDGIELCSSIRQNTATKHIPFILLTAKTDSDSKVRAMEAGVDAYIEKPFAVKYLEACIHNLLNRKPQTDGLLSKNNLK